MIVPWILYALAVGALVGGAALGVDAALRLLRRPTRGVWAGAILLALLLAGSALFRAAQPLLTTENAAAAKVVIALGPVPEPSLVAAVWETMTTALHAASAVPLERLGAALAHMSGSGWDRVLLAGWSALSLAVLLAFSWTALRYRAIRRRAPIARIHDTEVRVASELGPAVVGFFRHEIVVPRWLLAAPADEQRLILAHEVEHRRARDPLLLAAGWLAIVLVPWHPAIWWLASRLRLATEMDCDARVLRRGAEPLAYGSLLIAIAGRCAGIRVGVSALADSQSHLEQRLTAMIPTSRRFPLARGLTMTALALTAVFAACEASVPTAADVQKMDVASLEKSARSANFGGLADADFFVDEVKVSEAEATAIPADQIVTIRVMKKEGPVSASEVRIVTRAAPAGQVDAAKTPEVLFRTFPDSAGPAPLIFIDGVAADQAAMQALAPSRIQSIDVLKEASATREYGERATGGVIRITTKK